MRPELRHLRAFLAVAEQGSAHRAGIALFRAQSAVSRSIRKLETELGVELFERRARGMLLTEYGKALLVRARRVQAELKTARAEIASMGPRRDERTAAIFSMLTHERRVRAIVALAEQQHMPTVARTMGVTQPAISMAVRQLEDSVGTLLFQRTARGMIPTLAGAALVLHLKRALAEVRHAAADIDALRGHTRGTVTVGALPLCRTRLLPEAAAAIVAAHPGLRVATIEGSFEALAAGLRAGDIDFVLGALRPPSSAPDLEGIAVARDQLAIFVRRGHPLARRASMTLADLGAERWVLSRANTPNRVLFERALAERGLPPPDVVIETSDLAVVRGTLASSDLVTATSARQLAYEIEAGLVVRLPIALPETERQIGITRRADALTWPGAQLLMDELVRRAPSVLDVLEGAVAPEPAAPAARGKRRARRQADVAPTSP